MPLTIAEKAERLACVACSIATKKVQINSFEPFSVSPDDLPNMTFNDVAIRDDATLAVFKKAAADLVPPSKRDRPQIQARILGQKIDTNKKIQRFIDFVAALLF